MLAYPRYAAVVFPDIRAPHAPALRFTQPALAMPEPDPAPREFGAAESAFVHHALGRIGLDAGAYRTPVLSRRLRACLRALGTDSLDEARQLVDRDPAIADRAVDTLLLGVTAFFRDEAVFEQLARAVLPELLSFTRSPRIWSVGCSDGAELYSIAVLLARAGGLSGGLLLGTDCRRSAIAGARAGVFDAAVGGLPDTVRADWFEAAGDRLCVKPSLRTATRWWVANALAGTEAGMWHVILCRNLAMYLRPESANALWRRLAGALRPGGVLVVGKAERPAGCGLRAIGPSMFRRDGAGFAVR